MTARVSLIDIGEILFEISDISTKTDARPFSYGLPGFLPRCIYAAGAKSLACSSFGSALCGDEPAVLFAVFF
jgi:hypothetical protein